MHIILRFEKKVLTLHKITNFYVMSKQPVFLSFATQKGGAGKTTFTILAASWLHYKLGCNVAVIDCDHPQNSIMGIRDRDVKRVAANEHFKGLAAEQFRTLQKKAYPVIGCDVQRALRWAENGADDLIDGIIENMGFKDNLDLVLFDMPGTVNQGEIDGRTQKKKGVLTLLACMDYIFCPIKSDRSVIESSLMFVGELQERIIKSGVGTLKNIFMYWTEVDARESTRLYDMLSAVAARGGFEVMDTRIPFLLRFKKEITDAADIFKCTLFPAKPLLAKESRIDAFFEEMCGKIHLNLNDVH
jgi:cellulose biosynthesis protein BcsQ